MSIYEKIVKAEKEGRSYALATIVNTVGCTPRSAGTKMLVFTDGSTEGTVGGGLAEQLVIKDALSCMRSGRPLLKRYSPKTIKEADMEPDCVKTMDIFIEPHASGAVLYLLGSGHVAQAVLPLAVKTGFYTIVADTRPTILSALPHMRPTARHSVQPWDRMRLISGCSEPSTNFFPFSMICARRGIQMKS